MILDAFQIAFVLMAHSAIGIYSSTLKCKKKWAYLIWGTWIMVQGSLMMLSETFVDDAALQFAIGFILSLVGQYAIFFITTRGRFGQRLFTMLTYSVMFCIMMTFFTMIAGTFRDTPPVLVGLINVILLLGSVAYFLLYVSPLCRAAARNIDTGWGKFIIVNLVFMITVILSSVFPVRLESFEEPSFITFLFLSISVMTVYPVMFSSINDMSEASIKREVEAQNKMLLAQIEAENAQLTEDSRARHDRRHHNLVMLDFAGKGDVESLKRYLENLVEEEGLVWGGVRYCDNMTVNSVLTVYEKRARECGITVNISAAVSHENEITPKDLVIVIANLFENAINATSRLKGADKVIDIQIRESALRLLIVVENSCPEKLVFDESHHGIGIRSVIATTERYDGMYDLHAEDGTFTARVIMNLK